VALLRKASVALSVQQVKLLGYPLYMNDTITIPPVNRIWKWF